jgi:hypothetical protein
MRCGCGGEHEDGGREEVVNYPQSRSGGKKNEKTGEMDRGTKHGKKLEKRNERTREKNERNKRNDRGRRSENANARVSRESVIVNERSRETNQVSVSRTCEATCVRYCDAGDHGVCLDSRDDACGHRDQGEEWEREMTRRKRKRTAVLVMVVLLVAADAVVVPADVVDVVVDARDPV